MFHVRRRPADSQPRRRKKKPLGVSNGGNHVTQDREGPVLVEITHSGEGGRHVKLTSEPTEVSMTRIFDQYNQFPFLSLINRSTDDWNTKREKKNWKIFYFFLSEVNIKFLFFD